MAHHPVIPFNELAKNAGEVYRATRRESPLACVLLSVSYLERLLITVLSNFLIKEPTSKRLFDPNNGSLGQFSSCSDVAYCLGLIAKDVHTNLRIVGKIRNTFAHNDVPVDFDGRRNQEAEILRLAFEGRLANEVLRFGSGVPNQYDRLIGIDYGLATARRRTAALSRTRCKVRQEQGSY
jgi:hypothetical protein